MMPAGADATSSSRMMPRSNGSIPWPNAAGRFLIGQKNMAAAVCLRPKPRYLRQEMGKLKCRSPLASFGIWMLGPALLKFGSDEQKKHYLPQIARGEIRWCQGYSEPGSGSDLVSLQTYGDDKGDHWIVNGQKVWTSYADQADWIFCLVPHRQE